MPIRAHPSRRVPTALTLLLASAAGCATTATALGTMSAAQQSAQVAASVSSDAHILGVLHVSNLGEITAGVLAQQRATDSAVKSFATMMATDHSSLDQQGNTLAQQIGVAPAVPDSTLPRLQRMEADTLRATAAGPGFDRLYITQQVIAHQRTLNLVDASIARAQRAELRTALQSQVRPAVASHLALAQQIQGRLGQQLTGNTTR